MAENEEESEMAAQFGNVLRLAMGSGMQIREAQLRRDQMRVSERAAETDRQSRGEAGVAALVNRELYSPEFWRTAGAESIADRVTVAAHLSGHYPEARGAWMHAADILRNDYGINIESMNKDHPTSLVGRHAALRDALDDYFARQRLDAESDQALAPEVGQDQDTNREAQLGADAQPEATAQANEVDQAASQGAERAAASKSVDEDAHLALADRYGAESQQDQVNAQAEEQTGGRAPHQYQRVTDAQLEQIERHANAPQLALVRARQAAGFPQSTADRIASSTKGIKATKPAATGHGLGQGQEAGLSR
ncbi:hypothetical protein AB0K08_16025 [Citricoccus sp. NPDC055426]|uniref:hypothetical protein n=1 Tax=Citricoccus sp. NPDC055426 TaxID=3155536 RepID=UPI003436901B